MAVGDSVVGGSLAAAPPKRARLMLTLGSRATSAVVRAAPASLQVPAVQGSCGVPQPAEGAEAAATGVGAGPAEAGAAVASGGGRGAAGDAME